MEDIRLKTENWTFAGREWQLRCNMNVLADVQSIYGDLGSAFEGGMMRSVLDFLAAMLNDCAESNGWSCRYTGRQLGHELGWDEFQQIQGVVMDLVTSAISTGEEPEADEEDAEPKN